MERPKSTHLSRTSRNLKPLSAEKKKEQQKKWNATRQAKRTSSIETVKQLQAQLYSTLEREKGLIAQVETLTIAKHTADELAKTYEQRFRQAEAGREKMLRTVRLLRRKISGVRNSTIEERRNFLYRYDEIVESNLNMSVSDAIRQALDDLELPFIVDTGYRFLRQREQIESFKYDVGLRKLSDSNHRELDELILADCEALIGKDSGGVIRKPLTLHDLECLVAKHVKALHARDPITYAPDMWEDCSSWSRAFQKRYGLQSAKISGKRSENQPTDAELDQRTEQIFMRALREGIPLDEIWNGDETAVWPKKLQRRSLIFKRRAKLPMSESAIDSSTRYTVFLSVSMTGRKRKPVVIACRDKRRNYDQDYQREGVQGRVGFAATKSGWMCSEFFADILHAWDAELQASGKRAMLIVDNCASHYLKGQPGVSISEALSLQNLIVEYLLPNTTSKSQLLDVGVNRHVKAKLRRQFGLYRLNKVLNGSRDRWSLKKFIDILAPTVADIPPTMIINIAKKLYGTQMSKFSV